MTLETRVGSSQQQYIAQYGCYERHITLFLQWALARARGTTVFDVGANIGYYSVMLSRGVGPDGRVVAFEPTDDARQILLRNLDRGNCRNVTVENMVVCSDPRPVTMVIPDGFGEGAYAVPAPDQGSAVPSTTIDAYCAATGARPAIIKIDAEGLDLDIIKGASQTLDKRAPIIVFEYQPAKINLVSPTKPADLFPTLERIGYRPLFFRGQAHFAAELIDYTILQRIYDLWVEVNNAAHLDVLLWPPQIPLPMKTFELPT